jgi:2-oxoglutarate ferredoxin oxidoreductase subunit beta
MPHIWCPGCGIGTVLKALLDAIVESALPENDLAVVSGIGCTARVPGYVRLDSFHTTHGRSLPYATGLHLANPRLKVMVVSGDGDCSRSAAIISSTPRRNVDLLVICVNNFTYGMTGGQAGPMTPTGHRARRRPGQLGRRSICRTSRRRPGRLRRALDDAARAAAAGDDLEALGKPGSAS